MRKIGGVLVSLVVVVLIGVGNVFAHIPEPSLGPKWELVSIAPDWSTFYVNTRRIAFLQKDVVKVWELLVPRGEARREEVIFLKKILTSEGKDPNNAERFWYTINLYKFNCKTHQIAPLGYVVYSFGQTVLDNGSFHHEEWGDIVPGSVGEGIEKYVCNKVSPSIPNPPLGPEWKLIFTDSDGLTVYFNTRLTAYLPGGIVEVPTLEIPRGESRKKEVNSLKNYFLSEGEDPNEAERLWYIINLDEVSCKTQKVTQVEATAYSFGQTALTHESSQHEKWVNVVPGNVEEAIEKYVCKKYK